MKEYIEREAAILTLLDKGQRSKRYHLGDVWELNFDEIKEAIASIPAADVRSVVTCGKCKYGKYTGTEWFCDKHSGHADKYGEDASYHEYHSKHWFCADGEARAKLILNDELHAADLIKSIPAADVRPVVRGKWKTTRTILGLCCICSVCESCANTESRFCPYCGADMRLDDETT